MADCLAKNAAKEMIGKKEAFLEGVADRSILLTLMKQEVTEKWQKFYVNSPKSDILQDVITEVGKSQPSIGDRKVSVFLYKALRPYKRTGIFVRSIMSTLVLSRGIWWCALLT